MKIATLQTRVVQRVGARIRNGELTERGLARLAGISQPHMHNVLKGVRTLSPEMADQILDCLGMSVLDLFGPEEWKEMRQRIGGE
jgi:plasmid maintenance system antidote protein VapI